MQEPKVQLATFGRLLQGNPEKLLNYKLSTIKINDPEIIKTSGKEFHPTLVFSGNKNDIIEGMLFEVTESELDDCDKYEKQYKRMLVTFKSGFSGYIYIGSFDQEDIVN